MSIEPYDDIRKRSKEARITDITAYSKVRSVETKRMTSKPTLAQRLQGGFDKIQGGISSVQDVADVISANVNFEPGDIFGTEGLGSFRTPSLEEGLGLGGGGTRRKAPQHRKKTRRR